MKRYLVLIHVASKTSRTGDPAAQAAAIVAAVDHELEHRTTVFTSTVAYGFCGTSSLDSDALYKALLSRFTLYREDNISVIEVGKDISSTHPGLLDFQGRTHWMVT